MAKSPKKIKEKQPTPYDGIIAAIEKLRADIVKAKDQFREAGFKFGDLSSTQLGVILSDLVLGVERADYSSYRHAIGLLKGGSPHFITSTTRRRVPVIKRGAKKAIYRIITETRKVLIPYHAP